MKKTQINNQPKNISASHLASFVFLGLAIFLLLASTVLHFIAYWDANENQGIFGDYYKSIITLIPSFTYLGFIFFIVFAWLYVIYLFFNKGVVAHRAIFIAGNAVIGIGVLMSFFMWIVAGPIPAFNMFDWFTTMAFVQFVGNDISAASNPLLLIFAVVVFAVIILGFQLAIYGLISKRTRTNSLFIWSIVAFVIGAGLAVASVAIYIIYPMEPSDKLAISSLKWMDAKQVTFSVYSTVSVALILLSFMLLASSGTRSLGINAIAFAYSIVIFALMASLSVIFTVLYCMEDIRLNDDLMRGVTSPDRIYYSVYWLFMAATIISASFVVMSFGDTFKKYNAGHPIVR